MSHAGDKLRAIRLRCGLTTRDVAQASRRIAAAESNDDYAISHAWLIKLESGRSTPGVHKLFTLTAIYGVPIAELLGLYVNVAEADRYRPAPADTQLIRAECDPTQPRIEFPLRFAEGFDPAASQVLSQLVAVWGEVPVSLLQRLKLRDTRWGYIGLNDYTMYPLLRPGSVVQIDPRWRSIVRRPVRSEFDRPMYFVELRDRYICSWCEFQSNRLICLSHPLSPVPTRTFAYPQEAEILGWVSGIAARTADLPPAHIKAAPAAPSSSHDLARHARANDA